MRKNAAKPKPLKPARPERLPLTAEQRQLALDYIPLARTIAKGYHLSWPAHAEEFQSAAMLALTEAAQSFDPGRGLKFATFFRYRIHGALADLQRALIPCGFYDDPNAAPAFFSLALDPHLLRRGAPINSSDDPPVGHEMESADTIESWLRKLPAKHAQAMRAIYLHGQSQKQAAKTVGCSRTNISNLHAESMVFLNDPVAYREYLEPRVRPLKNEKD